MALQTLPAAFALVLSLATRIVAEEPFQVIWHAPTEDRYGCSQRYDIHIDYARYGLTLNTVPGSDGWVKGEVITIMYVDKLWPYLKGSDDFADDYERIHGGLPQSGDMEADFERLADLIEKNIPDKEFEGLAVLDFEKWRPLYDWNFKNGILGRYQRMSQKKVEEDRKDEDLSDEEIEDIARQEFDDAARRYFEGALIMAKGMRPKAKWGYYIYPLCNGADLEITCKEISYESIEKLTWMVNASGALFPSAYFKEDMPVRKQRPYIYGANSISMDWVKMSNDTFKPIYTYNSIVKPMSQYGPKFIFYDTQALVNGIGICADMGMNGVPMWGNGNLRNRTAACNEVKEFVEGSFGPYVQRVLEFTKKCSEDLCSSQGRCYKENIEKDSDKMDYDVESSHVYDAEKVKAEYKCRCYEGWKGDSCDQQV